MMPQASFAVAITTYNRSAVLANLLAEIRRLTSEEHVVVVCDDGSSDNTVTVARAAGAVVVAGENRGIAWNKNRGLYYLVNHTAAECILLIDDDMIPTVHGWEQEWMAATALYGHVNHAYETTWDFTRGPRRFTATHPGFNTQLTGVGLAFSRPCLAEIGYMDTRFGRYGHEHTEFTLRALRRGYGGLLGEQIYFLVISGGLRSVGDLPSHGSANEAEENRAALDRMHGEPAYRLPWRDDDEYRVLMREVEAAAGGAMRFGDGALDRYMGRYPDVKGEPVAAAIHWIHFGRREGRTWG